MPGVLDRVRELQGNRRLPLSLVDYRPSPGAISRPAGESAAGSAAR